MLILTINLAMSLMKKDYLSFCSTIYHLHLATQKCCINSALWIYRQLTASRRCCRAALPHPFASNGMDSPLFLLGKFHGHVSLYSQMFAVATSEWTVLMPLMLLLRSKKESNKHSSTKRVAALYLRSIL